MFPHTLLHYLEFIWDIILSRQELLFPFGHWSWWVNDFFVVKQSMTTSASHCTELRNVLNRPKDLPCQRGTSRLVQRNKICRQETTALWKIQTCAAHRCTSGLSALTDTHSTSWANGTCVPLQPGWCFCTITVTRLAGSCLRAGQPIFPLASWLLFFFFCFVFVRAQWKVIHWNIHVALAGTSGPVSAPFSQRKWVFQGNHILHRTVKFQGRVQRTGAFTLIRIKWQPIIFPLVGLWVTGGAEVSDVKSTINWMSRPWLQADALVS